MRLPASIIGRRLAGRQLERRRQGATLHATRYGCRPPRNIHTVAHGVITPITILLTFTSTAAIVVMFVMLGIVIKNERSWKGSRHRKTSKPIAPSVTNKVDDSSDYYRHCCGVRMYMVFIRCEYADCI
ncbi:hypothetical protein Y032_0463g1911 [Ancylostoma ceylanicum]|nr:hypothetical protein Y032_0463g1911 [Ancylostoma ceylanicum]